MGTSEPLFEMKSPIKTELKQQVIDHHRGAFCEPCRGYKQRLNYKASRQYRHLPSFEALVADKRCSGDSQWGQRSSYGSHWTKRDERHVMRWCEQGRTGWCGVAHDHYRAKNTQESMQPLEKPYLREGPD